MAALGAGCSSEAPPDPSIDQVASPITLPASFSDTLVATVGSPTALAFTPDGRLLVTTQGGQLRVVDTAGTMLGTAALDLSAKLCSNSERGVLGVAVDPAFPTNRRIYLYYTFKKFGSCPTNTADIPVNRVSRFVLSDTNRVDPATEVVLVDNIQSPGGNHNAGDLHFGPDNLLYISVGDGGCKLGDSTRCGGQNDNARSLDTLLGKILRVGTDGSIPAANPNAGVAGARRCGDPAGVPAGTGPCKEMYAWGLRNPFRFSFKQGSSEMFINDVGQNAWEEIDRGAIGADYGWSVREGHCANGSTSNCGAPPAGMTNPIFDYRHDATAANAPFDGCNSITGGAFIPSGAWGSAYDGAFIFSDYVCGRMFKLAPSGSGFTATSFATGLGGSSAVTLVFGSNAGKTGLYYTTYAGGGQVRRITADSGNRAPTAAFTRTPAFGDAPLAVTFDGSGSSDPDAGDTLTYVWTFGDGSATAETTTATTSHTYTANGAYTASLRVRDRQGALSAAVTARVDVGNTAPVPAITSPTTTQKFAVGQSIVLRGSATDAEDGTLADSRLSWSVLLHHNSDHTHPFLPATTGNNITITAPAPEDLDATKLSYLEILLTATDSRGLSRTISQSFLPRLVDVRFDTSPTGLGVEVNAVTRTAPVTLTSWEGYTLNVNAAAQTAGGNSYAFASWSDGGAARHAIVTPAAAATYTATFTTTTTGVHARVNFQPASAAIPAGYAVDSGLLYGARAGGQTYGWNIDGSALTRDRNVSTSADQRYDTLIHTQRSGDARWEIAVPNGSYRVHVVAGDASYNDSVYSFAVEGTVVVSGTPTTTNRWFEGTATVTVSDGKLTLTNATGSKNNKLCFIDIDTP
jgi:glucose/arabinose dehydrogenase/PKD repeat protein